MPTHTTRSLTRRYVLALASLAVLAAWGFASMHSRTSRGRNAAHVVNVAGGQRAFAERMTTTALVAAQAAPAARARWVAALDGTAAEWAAREAELRTGAAARHVNAPSADVARLLDGAAPLRRRVVAAAHAVAGGRAAETDELMASRDAFVRATDGIVVQLERESRERVDGLERAQAVLLVVTLLVLVVEALLVFRPATQRLARLVDELRDAGAVLEAQNDRLADQACELEAQNEELVMQGEELVSQSDEIFRAQEFLRTLVSSSNDAIVATDCAHRYLEVNPQAERMFGRSREELLGLRAYEVFPFLDAADERGRVERMLEDGRPYTVERSYPALGSGVYETAYSPLRDADGEIVGALCVTRDATARKSYERALVIARDAAEEANRARGEFLARMNHELRTPLTVIIGFTRVLAHSASTALGAAERGYLERVDTHSRHLLALVNDVLDVAKIDAGEMSVELLPTDVARLTAETVTGFEVQAVGKGLWLRTELPQGPVVLGTDPTRLRQVLTNLLANAVKFTERGGVTVRVRPDAGGACVVEVSDTGIGIPPSRQEAVFDAFEQADVATHRQYGGTGLGLSISRSLCELLGAQLSVESEEGRGTTFRVAFAAA